MFPYLPVTSPVSKKKKKKKVFAQYSSNQCFKLLHHLTELTSEQLSAHWPGFRALTTFRKGSDKAGESLFHLSDHIASGQVLSLTFLIHTSIKQYKTLKPLRLYLDGDRLGPRIKCSILQRSELIVS